MNLSLTQLAAIMPGLRLEQAVLFLPHLNDAMAEADCTTPIRAAAFLAQLAHESNELRNWEEKPHLKPYEWCRYCQKHGPHAAGEQYEGRRDIGNDRPGDGVLFKGRGPIQLTGRANYRAAGLALGLPLEEHPERVGDAEHAPAVGMRTVAWYWTAHRCNEPADAGDFEALTRRINGGTNGLEQRKRYHHIAQNVLGAHPEFSR